MHSLLRLACHDSHMPVSGCCVRRHQQAMTRSAIMHGEKTKAPLRSLAPVERGGTCVSTSKQETWEMSMSRQKRQRNTTTYIVLVGYTGYKTKGRKDTFVSNVRKDRLRVGARDERQARELVDEFLGNDGHSIIEVWEADNWVSRFAKSLPRGLVVHDMPFISGVYWLADEPKRMLEDARRRAEAESERQAEARMRTMERKRRKRNRLRSVPKSETDKVLSDSRDNPEDSFSEVIDEWERKFE